MDEVTAGTLLRRGDAKRDESLKSLTKVARVMECFSTVRRSLSLSEICKLTGYPRSTTHRLVTAMKEVGFIEQDRGREDYRLGLRLFEFGNIVLANLDLHREGRPIVDALHRLTSQTVHLAVFDGFNAVVIQRTESPTESGIGASFVESSPTYCTSVGKAILAFQPGETVERVIAAGLRRYTETTITDPAALRAEMEAIRGRGYAIDEAEHQPGLRCVGAPIRNQKGAVFAAMSVSSPAWQLPQSEIGDLSSVVIYHANMISQLLGFGR
jgi:DNA-binding IclR family transcriptional regulator